MGVIRAFLVLVCLFFNDKNYPPLETEQKYRKIRRKIQDKYLIGQNVDIQCTNERLCLSRIKSSSFVSEGGEYGYRCQWPGRCGNGRKRWFSSKYFFSSMKYKAVLWEGGIETGIWATDCRSKIITRKQENVLMREINGAEFQLVLKAHLRFMPYVTRSCGMWFSLAMYNHLGAGTRMAEIKI